MAKEHLSRQTGIVQALDVVQAGGVSVAGVAITATPAELNAAADLSANGALIKTVVIPITTAPTGSEQDTGVDLPAKAVVLGVFVNVTAAEATGGTKTLDVGLLSSESGGDADGFLAGVSVAATGLKGGSLVAAGVTLGLLSRETVTDSNSDTLNGRKPHLSDSVTAKSVSYTAGDVDWVEFRGSIVILYVEVA